MNLNFKYLKAAIALLICIGISNPAFASDESINSQTLFDLSSVSNEVPMPASDYNYIQQALQYVNAEFIPTPDLVVNPNVSAREALNELQMIFEEAISPQDASILNCAAIQCSGQ